MKKRKMKGKKQWRLLPKYKVDIHSGKYKRKLRESLLQEWPYAAHWVDSAIKTAYSILSLGEKTMLQEAEEAHRKKTLCKSQTNTHKARG